MRKNFSATAEKKLVTRNITALRVRRAVCNLISKTLRYIMDDLPVSIKNI